MSDQEKSKAELIEELAAARQRIKELETIEDELHLICEVLANAAGQIFWAMTPDFSRMSIINPVACDISGYPHEEFVINPKRWFELVHPDDLQGLNEAIEAHEKNGRRKTRRQNLTDHCGGRALSDTAGNTHDRAPTALQEQVDLRRLWNARGRSFHQQGHVGRYGRVDHQQVRMDEIFPLVPTQMQHDVEPRKLVNRLGQVRGGRLI